MDGDGAAGGVGRHLAGVDHEGRDLAQVGQGVVLAAVHGMVGKLQRGVVELDGWPRARAETGGWRT